MVECLFIISITLFAAGSLFALCFYRWQMLGNYLSLILAAIASCFNIVIATSVLFNHSAIRFNFLLYHAIIKYSFLIDSLSAIFILAISVISFIASIYSLGYTKLYVNKRDTRFLGFNFNFFLLS